MTSRELIKVWGVVVASVVLHVFLFSVFSFHYEPDIKFVREKTRIRLHPFRPVVPRNLPVIEKMPRKGPLTPGVSEDTKGGLKSEEVDMGESKRANEEYDQGPTPELARGADESDSILSEFFAMVRSDKFQRKLEDVRREKERAWTGKGVGSEDLSLKRGGGGGKYREPYLDPRVKLVVVSYPPSSIETDHPYITYPDLQVKKNELPSGWCNVVLRIYTDERGNVVKRKVLRPEGRGIRDRLFLEHTLASVKDWKYPRVKAEVIIDVRYFVE